MYYYYYAIHLFVLFKKCTEPIESFKYYYKPADDIFLIKKVTFWNYFVIPKGLVEKNIETFSNAVILAIFVTFLDIYYLTSSSVIFRFLLK